MVRGARFRDSGGMHQVPPSPQAANPTSRFLSLCHLTRRFATALLALALVATACGAGEDTIASTPVAESTGTSEPSSADPIEPTPDVAEAAKETAESDATSADVSDWYEGVGNPDADTVIVNTQGGPLVELASDELRDITDLLDLETTYVVNVHQEQTLDPDRFTTQDLAFDEAKAADAASVDRLAAVVQHFVDEDRPVIVLGISFGAFMAQELLATQGNIADGYVILVGRVDMPEAVWSAFADGRAAGFANGTDIVEFEIEEAGMGVGTAAGDRNMARLAAGLGHHRYSERLSEVDLSNVYYGYGEVDEQVGRLTDDEIAFLQSQGATVARSDRDHGGAIDDLLIPGLGAVAPEFGDDSSANESSADALRGVEIPQVDVPVGDAILAAVQASLMNLSTGTSYTFDGTGFEPEIDLAELVGADIDFGIEPGPAVIAFSDDALLAIPFGFDEEPIGTAALITMDGVFSAQEVEFDLDEDTGTIQVVGTATGIDDPSTVVDFAAVLSIGAGSSSFALDGNRAVVRGTLGARTFDQVEYLIAEHPEIDTLVLQSIDGSENDAVNVFTARLVREAGYTTHVPADGEIYSGGVDLFAAGVTRTAEPGATLGVHAWCCGPNGESAHELAQDDAAHDLQLAYFSEVMGPVAGPKFYFFTLQAAPFDGIEAMTAAELDVFDLVTADAVLAAPTPRAIDGLAASTITQIADDTADWLSPAGSAEVLVVIEGAEPYAVIAVEDEDSVVAEMVTVDFAPEQDGWRVDGAVAQVVCNDGVEAGFCL